MKLELRILYVYILATLVLVSCAKNDIEGVWKNQAEDVFLLIENNRLTRFHSNDHNCISYSIDKEQKELILDSIGLGLPVGKSKLHYDIEGSDLYIDSHKYHRLEPITYDSVLIKVFQKERLIKQRPLVDAQTYSSHLLAASILSESFQYLDTALVSNDRYLEFLLYQDGNIVGRKVGASNLLCLEYYPKDGRDLWPRKYDSGK